MGSCWLWNRSIHKQTSNWAAPTQVKPTCFHIKCVMTLSHREKVTLYNDAFVRQIKESEEFRENFLNFKWYPMFNWLFLNFLESVVSHTNPFWKSESMWSLKEVGLKFQCLLKETTQWDHSVSHLKPLKEIYSFMYNFWPN